MTTAKKYAVTGVMVLVAAAFVWVMIQLVALIVGLLLVPVLLGLIIAWAIRAKKAH